MLNYSRRLSSVYIKCDPRCPTNGTEMDAYSVAIQSITSFITAASIGYSLVKSNRPADRPSHLVKQRGLKQTIRLLNHTGSQERTLGRHYKGFHIDNTPRVVWQWFKATLPLTAMLDWSTVRSMWNGNPHFFVSYEPKIITIVSFDRLHNSKYNLWNKSQKYIYFYFRINKQKNNRSSSELFCWTQDKLSCEISVQWSFLPLQSEG